MSWLFGFVGVVALVVGLFAIATWTWTGPVFAPWRAERERLRSAAAKEAEYAALRPQFEEAFAGWPEFRRETATMFDVQNLEEDRRSGYKRDGPGWPDFVEAAAAARTAAESICQGWRQEAIAVTAPLAELREPIDPSAIDTPMARLQDFVQLRDNALRSFAQEAGINVQDFARRLREPSSA